MDDLQLRVEQMGDGSPWTYLNLLCKATLSRLTPRITTLFSRNYGTSSRKLQACFVHPEVMPFG